MTSFPVIDVLAPPLKRDKAGYVVLSDTITDKQVQALSSWLKDHYNVNLNPTYLQPEEPSQPPKLALRLTPTDVDVTHLLNDLQQQDAIPSEAVAAYQEKESAYQAQFKGPIGWFRKRLQEKALSTIGGIYLAADAMSGAIGAINSVNMLQAKGSGDLGYTALAGSSSAAMMLYGSPEQSSTPAAHAHAQMMEELTQDPSLSWLVDRHAPAEEVTLKGSFDQFMVRNAENIGMVNNAFSGMALAKAGLEQNGNPLKFAQGAIITTSIGVPYMVLNFGKQLNSIFGNLPGIAGKAWDYLYTKPRDIIKLAVLHNIVGVGTSILDLWRSPRERAKLIEDFAPDTHPEYLGFQASIDEHGQASLTRAGDWRDMSTQDMRETLSIMRAGWVAVDASGVAKAPTVEELELLDEQETPKRTLMERGGASVTMIPLEKPMKPAKVAKFEKALIDYQMFQRLPISATINFAMIATYMTANILWSTFKPAEAKLDTQEQLSLAAAELLKPVAGTAEQQAQRQAILLDYMADKLKHTEGFKDTSHQEIAGAILQTAESLANSPAAALLQTQPQQHGGNAPAEAQALNAVSQSQTAQQQSSLEPLLAIAKQAYGKSISSISDDNVVAQASGTQLQNNISYNQL